MRNMLLALTGVCALAVASPAAAQVYIGTDAPGVGVHVGVGSDRHERRGYRDRDDAYARGSCREVKTRTETPDGRRITTTKRVCD